MQRILYLLLLFPVFVTGQTQSENYIKTTTYKVRTSDGITATEGGAVTDAKKTVSVTYIDGLGRPIQQIASKQSGSGKDIITHIEYDIMGRANKDYMPYLNGSSSMAFDANGHANVEAFYSNPTLLSTGNANFEATAYSYSRKFYDSSPLSRVLKQSAPGNDWVGHESDDADKTVKFVYGTNSVSDKVWHFYVNAALLASDGYFQDNQLYKTIAKNENWISGNNNTTEEFKDNQGRLVLKRAYDNTIAHDTYYVYDPSGNLAFVIPPKASENIATIQESQSPYRYYQDINFYDLLLSYSGGGGGGITIENNTLKLSFGGSFNPTQIDVSKSFTINASRSVPDMTIGTLTAGFGRYTAYIQNNQLKFLDNYPNAGTFTSFGQALTVPLDTAQFGTIPVYTTVVNQNVIADLCYQYKYDPKFRLIEKKIPGKQWEFIVYDKLDRVVATGPTYSPFGGTATSWTFTKYDVLGRPAYTGWYVGQQANQYERIQMQTAQNSYTVLYESRLTTNTIGNVTVGYSNAVFPTQSFFLLSASYYDDYSYPNAPVVPTAVLSDASQPVYYNNSIKPKGLPTGSWVRILESEGLFNGNSSYILYDNKMRPIRTRISNYLGGYTQVDSKIDFSGKALYTETTHKRLASDTELYVKDSYTYTDQDRPLAHTHQVGNAGIPQLLSKNNYDELGQLISKKVGGTDVTSFSGLQNVNYSYNVRGWLTEINKVNSLAQIGDAADLFAFKLNYNTVEETVGAVVKPLYNGNISETYWRTGSDNVLRKYGYGYDNLNRLRNAVYQKPVSGAPAYITNAYNESIQYDKNGNITTLNRNGYLDGGPGTDQEIDNLFYVYGANSNRLDRVDDASLSTNGFSDGSTTPLTGNDYSYDANGNMIVDNNKGITAITYNHLDLPVKLLFGSEKKKIEYLYDAMGIKLKKTVTTTKKVDSKLVDVIDTIDYLDGFQYYNSNLQFFPTSEGYVDVTRSLFTGSTAYNYVFNYTDHLGNVRLSYGTDTSTGNLKIIEENHYYPFGMKHTNYNLDVLNYNRTEQDFVMLAVPAAFPIGTTAKLPYNYKYNGKEFQDELGLNLYDYGARNYDAVLGRWMNIDPLAETSRRFSPYAYALNNPIFFIDPDGMSAMDIFSLNKQTGNINLVEKTNDSFDTLVSSNDKNEVISNNVDKGLLRDGQNIMKNGLETSDVKGGIKLLNDISVNTHDEIGGMIFKNKKNETFLRGLPYEHSNVTTGKNGGVTMEGGLSVELKSPYWTSSDKTFSGTIAYMFHTHPGNPDFPMLGLPFPSPKDYELASENYFQHGVGKPYADIYKNLKYFVIGSRSQTINGVTSDVGVYQHGKGRWLSPTTLQGLIKK